MQLNRSFIVHAHFYQPPRENPETDEVPVEIGAFPYHDWNEKIFETCYLPNIQIGNFSQISYDVGPTLIRWLRSKHPEALQAIVEADLRNFAETGHGNAIAQPYHHSILPLATRDEKITEISWGIQDFFHTFGRNPEGMWLPETAVDIETLCIMADLGIKFTILAPWQVQYYSYQNNSPFLVNLPENRKIVIFPYSGELSARASFDGFATSNADYFVSNYIASQYINHDPNQYVMMATDGELYGHHQTFREMFLSQLVNGSLKSNDIKLEYPSDYLDRVQDLPIASIYENTSWSCHHGIKRWQVECDCTPGALWKSFLRDSLNKIAHDIDFLCGNYFEKFGIILTSARTSYIRVLLGEIPFNSWISSQTTTHLGAIEREIISNLIKAQQYRLRMFASCGWFFNEFDRIEPRNSIVNAAYAGYLIDKALNTNVGQKYSTLLSKIRSSETGITGDMVYKNAYASYKVN